MPLDTLRLILLSLKYILPYAFTALLDKCRALIHAQTYKPVPSPKNIIIAGASFAGIQVAQKLAHSIPPGYRVLPIARNEARYRKDWSEFTGPNFSPNRRTLFANVQEPGTVYAIDGPWRRGR